MPQATPEGSVIDELLASDPVAMNEKRSSKDEKEVVKGKSKAKEVKPQKSAPEQSAYAAQVTRTLTNAQSKATGKQQPKATAKQEPLKKADAASTARPSTDADKVTESVEASAPNDVRDKAEHHSSEAQHSRGNSEPKSENNVNGAPGLMKKILGGAPLSPSLQKEKEDNMVNSVAPATAAPAEPTTNGTTDTGEKVQMGANLLGTEGNDVLWYKGMGKDGLWVSGT